MKSTASLLSLAILIACGSEAEKEKNLEDTSEISYLVKKVRLKKDAIYSSSCTPGLTTAFLMTQTSKACNAVTLNTDYTSPITWKIKSSDNAIDLTMIENDNGTAIVNGTTYFCLNFSGNVYTSKGDIQTFGSHLVLSKTKASTPTSSTTGDIDFVFAGDDDFCNALY